MRAEPRVEHVRAPHALPRALAATFVVLAGAAAAHTWAGGTVPTAPGLALVAVVVLVGGLLLFTRNVPVRALLPVVAAAQLGLHESFGLVAEHGHHAHHALDASPTASGPGWTWQMACAHLFVTALTAALWWTGRRAVELVVSLVRHPGDVVADDLRAPHAEVRTRSSRGHLLVPPRRGPPMVLRPT